MKKLFWGATLLCTVAFCLSGCKEHKRVEKTQVNKTEYYDDDDDDDVDVIEEEVEVDVIRPDRTISTQNINQRTVQQTGQKINQNPVRQQDPKLNQNTIQNPVKPYNEDKNRIPNSNLR